MGVEIKRKMRDSNFLPNIRCPFCNHSSPYAISGFAGELSVREKQCPKCEKEFVMVVYVCASFPGSDANTDGVLSSLKERIKWLRRQGRKTKGQLLLEYNQVKKLNDEALEQAREMAKKRGMN